MRRVDSRRATMWLCSAAVALVSGGAAAVDEAPPPTEAALERFAATEGGGTTVGPSAVALPSSLLKSTASTIQINDLAVFGDSYSRLQRKTFPNWAEQLRNEGSATRLRGFAVSGATASPNSAKTFGQQITRWKNSGFTYGAGDSTVVYFGYNDIDSFDTFVPSRTAYKSGVNALIAGNATANDRKLFVVMPHDWGSIPKYNASPALRQEFRDKTILWNKFVASLPASLNGVVAVDLFSAIDKVIANPGAYGFTNVKDALPAKSGSTALYDDTAHFGRRGQEIVKQTIANAMNRTGAYARTLAVSRATQEERQRDINTGLSFSLAALDEEERLGLTAFPVGLAALPEARKADADISRAGFAQATSPDLNDGGVGFNYALSDETMLGVVISEYGEAERSEIEADVSAGELRSDAVSLYFRHKLGRFELTSQAMMSDDRHTKLDYDGITDRHDRAAYDGRTTQFEQRVGVPIERTGFTLTPWVGLAYGVQKVDDFTISSPFSSDQTYATGDVHDTVGSFGLDGRLHEVRIGERTSLSLRGGLSYTHGIAQDDYEVRVEEAAFGNAQEEVIERPETRTLGLSLAGDLAVGERFGLNAGLAVDHDLEQGTSESARVGLTYRF